MKMLCVAVVISALRVKIWNYYRTDIAPDKQLSRAQLFKTNDVVS